MKVRRSITPTIGANLLVADAREPFVSVMGSPFELRASMTMLPMNILLAHCED
jgi:hypothetical protein